LRTVFVYNNAQPFLVGDGVPAFCAALRASHLRSLLLLRARLFVSLLDDLAVLDAFTGRRSIKELHLAGNSPQSPEAQLAVGQALGRLVAAESALTYLDLRNCGLGDAGVGPLFAALAQNTALRTLLLTGNGISRECAQDVVLLWFEQTHRCGSLSSAARHP
jgi:Ran GTPase-activating protein (RanGAP) involved in mRNA processing and transport